MKTVPERGTRLDSLVHGLTPPLEPPAPRRLERQSSVDEVQPFRLDPLRGKELKEALSGHDRTAAVVSHVDDEPVLGEQPHDTRDLRDEGIDFLQSRATT